MRITGLIGVLTMTCKDLVFSPHADDEVLGCGGILNENSFVYYCGIDESKMDTGQVAVDERLKELKAAAKFLGIRWDYNKESKVNLYKEQDFIPIFEKLINELKPERVFIPCPDYNQDHKAVYNAAWIALRPHDINFFVKKVLLYETSQHAIWNPFPLKLNYFVPIEIERKIKAYGYYKSEVRKMRSPEMLRNVARIRGQAINVENAEAFEILRWVE